MWRGDDGEGNGDYEGSGNGDGAGAGEVFAQRSLRCQAIRRILVSGDTSPVAETIPPGRLTHAEDLDARGSHHSVARRSFRSALLAAGYPLSRWLAERPRFLVLGSFSSSLDLFSGRASLSKGLAPIPS